MVTVMTPSHAAIAAALELRRWARRQQAATGLPPSPETTARRIATYGLTARDLDYVTDVANPFQKPTTADFLNDHAERR